MNLTELTLLATNIPQTVEWNFNVAIIMIASNLFAIFIGRFAIKQPGSGDGMKLAQQGLWKNFGFPELLATMSFGHILGAGFILGLSNAGLLL